MVTRSIYPNFTTLVLHLYHDFILSNVPATCWFVHSSLGFFDFSLSTKKQS